MDKPVNQPSAPPQHARAPAGSAAPLAMAQALLGIRGGRAIFAPVSFAITAGSSLLVTGPNGIGKSSLIRMIAGLLPVRIGTVRVDARCALADERLAMDGDRTLRDALLFWAMLGARDVAAVDKALATFALLPLAEVPVRMLSTGQRKRASMARVAASGAPIWLLDEPGNGLDTASLDLLGAAMTAHVSAGGAIIAASHFALPFAFTGELALMPPDPGAGDGEGW